MASETKHSRTLACIALVLLGSSACDDSESRTPLPDWSDGYADDVVVDGGGGGGGGGPGGDTSAVQFGTYADMPEGSFALVVPRSVEHPVRLRERGTADSPCGIAPAETAGGPPRREMECILEMDELDLYVQGLRFDVVVPDGGCEYLRYHLGMYENYEAGIGPTEVAWTVSPDGTFTDNVNAMNGKPFCPYDYSEQFAEGPNCCVGSYEQTVTGSDGKVTVTFGSWGGKPGDCYDGAAYLDKDAVVDKGSGLALGKYRFNEDELGAGFTEHIETHGLSANYGTTVPLASFYDPDDHADTMPAAFTGDYVVPVASFYCLDNAQEVRARITLVVREWNEEVEFDRDGDPDTQGMEASWPELPLDDFPDFAELTPGADTWPEQVPRRQQ